ncbi:unnamed protein product [Polarella glacialis]|uniref:Transcription factor TFIIB cyclin-like domain-containing protein n=2 Tax=Polarella glacialis TaxID=89957 RepID=A0A813FCX6_POLGL|nr:unnamed protein product [Polarella glacialis]
MAGASPDAESCDQCGSRALSEQLGVPSCGQCGAVQSFDSQRLAYAHHGQRQMASPLPGSGATASSSSSCQLIQVQAPLSVIRLSRELQVVDGARSHRIQRCRAAISLVTNAAGLSSSVQEPAQALLLDYCQRAASVPGKGPRLKRLVSACILIASSRQGMGLTIHEVACHARLRVIEVQKMIWKVCKACGVRVLRDRKNLDSLLLRICQHLNLNTQRGAVCSAASQLVHIACKGWLSTGRMWSFLVSAAFLLAARAYHYSVDVEDVARMLGINASTIEVRIREIKTLLVSLLRFLPWGHMVSTKNVHVYLLFAVDFFEILEPVAPMLRRQQLEMEASGQDAESSLAKRRRVTMPDESGTDVLSDSAAPLAGDS